MFPASLSQLSLSQVGHVRSCRGPVRSCRGPEDELTSVHLADGILCISGVLEFDKCCRQTQESQPVCGSLHTGPKQMHLADVAASGEVCIPKPGGFLATHTLLRVPNRMNCRSTKSVTSPVIVNPHLTWPSGKPIIVCQDARTSSSRSLSCSFGSMPPTYTRAACIR